MPKLPNILLTGTPGTGKSTLAAALAAAAPGMHHVNVGELVRDKGLHEGWDEEYESYILDEDRICDELEDPMEEGGVILELADEGGVWEELERGAKPLDSLARACGRHSGLHAIRTQAHKRSVAAAHHCESRVGGAGAIGGDILPSHGTGEG